jgi:dolichyl-phosphate beta-glucosyltransferase
MIFQSTLCLVIPCFNESLRLQIDQFKIFLESNPSISICFVDDGSGDNTVEVIKTNFENHERVDLLELKENGGKAEAVRKGVLSLEERDFKYIGFWDADLATPLKEAREFVQKADEGKYLSVMGARVLRLGGKVSRKWYRHLLGRVFASLASIVLKIPVYDTQCGAKIYEKELAIKIFKEKFLSYWIFDIELFFRIRDVIKPAKLEDHLYEHPLSKWDDVAGSKLSIFDFVKAPLELLRIFFRYR